MAQVCTTEIFKFRASFQRNKKIASTALIVTLSICMENSDQRLSNDMYINLHTPVLTKTKYTYKWQFIVADICFEVVGQFEI